MAGLDHTQPGEGILIQMLTPEVGEIAATSPAHALEQATMRACTNLPAPTSSFIGRAQEVAEVKRLLAGTRLVTLTGAGGCGKTRLAVEVAAANIDKYRDGVWLVELAALAEPDLVPQALAAVLGIREQSDEPLSTTLGRILYDKQILLVIDNCEHLIAAAARLVYLL